MMEILRILQEKDDVLGAKVISEELDKRGYSLGERAVRYHMHILDEKGFSKKVGYKGRVITEEGLDELKKGLIYEQVDFTSTYFQEKLYNVTLDPQNKKGKVVVNLSSFKDIESLDIINEVFDRGLAVSKHHNIYSEDDVSYIETVCGTTIDGVFQRNGIISKLLYGGLLNIEDYKPLRFTEQIAYSKTSITPLEAFTNKDYTSVLDVLTTGTGVIPANIREIPAIKKHEAIDLLKSLKRIDIDGVIQIGEPGKSVLGVPIEDQMIGIAVVGGVAPLCAAQEAGFDLNIKLADKHSDFNKMRHDDTHINLPLKGADNTVKKPVSFILNKIYTLMSMTDFDPFTHEGNVIANLSYVKKEDLDQSIEILSDVYKSKPAYCMGNRYIVQDATDGYKAIATICSLTIDGILTSCGISSIPVYGGLLDISKKDKRFIELISYTGSSLDPHEIFIKKGLHDIKGALENTGSILANVHSVPYIAREDTIDIFDEISDAGFKVMHLGKPNEYLYNARIERYNFGYVVQGGLNPVVRIKEEGINIGVKSLETIMEFNSFEEF